MEIWIGIIKTSFARVFGLLMNTASLALTAHMLGPEGRGIIAGVTTVVNVVSTVGSLSLGQVIINRAAQQGDLSWMRPAVSSLILCAAVLSPVAWVVTAGLWFVHADLFGSLPSWALILGFATLPFIIWEGYGTNVLIASGDLSFFNRRLVATTACGFALLAMVLMAGAGVTGALAAMLGTNAMVAIVGFYRLWSRVQRTFELRPGFLRSLVIDGAKLHFNAIGGVLILGMDVLMVNYYLTPSDVGHYQLAVQLLGAMMIVPACSALVLNQAMSRYGPNGVWPMQRNLLFQTVILMSAAGLIAYALAPFLIRMIAGPAFDPAVETFRLSLLSVIGMTLSYGMANQWLGRGLFIQTAILTVVSGLANLLLNRFFIPRLGINGAALSTVIVYNSGALISLAMAIYLEFLHRNTRAQVRAVEV